MSSFDGALLSFLACPDCGGDAIESKNKDEFGYCLWSEDDEGTCPDCGALVGAYINDSDEDHVFIEAKIIKYKCGHTPDGDEMCEVCV